MVLAVLVVRPLLRHHPMRSAGLVVFARIPIYKPSYDSDGFCLTARFLASLLLRVVQKSLQMCTLFSHHHGSSCPGVWPSLGRG